MVIEPFLDSDVATISEDQVLLLNSLAMSYSANGMQLVSLSIEKKKRAQAEWNEKIAQQCTACILRSKVTQLLGRDSLAQEVSAGKHQNMKF